MVGLVIDGGTLFAGQRAAQNDRTRRRRRGTVVIAEKLGGATRTGAQVHAAMTDAAAANGLGSWTAVYTDDFGTSLGVTVDAADSDPGDGPRRPGDRDADRQTTFSRVLGFDRCHVSADATVVAGALNGRASPTTTAARCCP